jgi:hypothetical protein
VKTHSANRRGSGRRSIHTLRPCGTHKHHASEKIVNRCCRRPLLAEHLSPCMRSQSKPSICSFN